jgi:hypothetical protein
MKYLLFLLLILTPIANAQSWIKLDVPKGYINYIDRDSIKTKGDFTYYTMKDTSEEGHYRLIKFKHDCKYDARQTLSSDYYDRETNKLIRPNTYSNSEMGQYPRSYAMIKVERMVCR